MLARASCGVEKTLPFCCPCSCLAATSFNQACEARAVQAPPGRSHMQSWQSKMSCRKIPHVPTCGSACSSTWAARTACSFQPQPRTRSAAMHSSPDLCAHADPWQESRGAVYEWEELQRTCRAVRPSSSLSSTSTSGAARSSFSVSTSPAVHAPSARHQLQQSNQDGAVK